MMRTVAQIDGQPAGRGFLKTRPLQRGFTLLELLISLAIIAILSGVGIATAPRLLSDTGPGALARRLAGAGQEAGQMALLQQRPWELLLDLDEGIFYRSPLGYVTRLETRLPSEAGYGEDDGEAAEYLADALSSAAAPFGGRSEEELSDLRREELDLQARGSLRVTRRYDRLAFSHDDVENDIFVLPVPEDVRIIQIWKQGGQVETAGRVSLVFGPRGFIKPTVVWLEDAAEPGGSAYTLYFAGVMPPVVADGLCLPDVDGELMPVDAL